MTTLKRPRRSVLTVLAVSAALTLTGLASATAAPTVDVAAASKAAPRFATSGAECPKSGPVNGSRNTPAFRMANANIKVLLSSGAFASDYSTALSYKPDALTLNEINARSTQDLTRSGYAWYRPTERRVKGNAVVWRTDTWRAVTQGEIFLIDGGPAQYDDRRGATWVTLAGRSGQGQVSVVATHHMVNPAKYGPDKATRQALYAEGMKRLRNLVQRLSASGPVFVAGDFNSAFYDTNSWAPRTQFAPIGMKAAMEGTWVSPTHDGGGRIDYVFHQPDRAAVHCQSVVKLLSDHHLLVNDFTLAPTQQAPRKVKRRR